MFGKLMKYECKAYMKIVLPLWAGEIVLSILNGFTLKLLDREQFGLSFLGVTLPMLLYLTSFVATAVVSYILILKRFWNGLLGREGYLMCTLPVSRDQLIVSKMLCAVAVNLISTVVGITAVFLTVLMIGGADVAGYLPDALMDIFDELEMTASQSFIVIVQGIFLSIFTAASGILKLYAAMSIGHLAKKNRILWSVAAYVGFGLVSRTVTNLLYAFDAVSDVLADIVDNYQDIFASGFDLSSTALGVSILVAIITILIYGSITRTILNKRLNLD